MASEVDMAAKDAGVEILQGTLDSVALQALATMGPLHVYALAARLEQVSDHPFTLNQGTLYASLVRLAQRGWIKGSWQTTENNREANIRRDQSRSPRVGQADRTLAAALRPGRQTPAGEAVIAACRRFLARLVALLRPAARPSAS